DAHRGSIEVESELGSGSKFTVRLPISFGAHDSITTAIEQNGEYSKNVTSSPEAVYPEELKNLSVILSIQDRIYARAIERYFIHNDQEFISLRTAKDFSKIPQKNLDSHRILIYDTRLLLEETEVVRSLRDLLLGESKFKHLVLLETADIPLPFQEDLLPFFPDYTIQNPFSLDKLKSILIEIQKEIYLGDRTEKEEYSS
ncbi:PAS domain-containing sensor histidine kinase, partial [Leptospira bandrabouensis]|nr:PAS domain-containing sensor histidine kinase [Leptospira bandrabouensis]